VNRYDVRPVTAGQWDRLAEFFGPSGAYSHCWCAWWRVPSKDFDAGCRDGGTGNREVLRRLTEEGRVPGLLAYRTGEPDTPVGWVSVAPRAEFGRVRRSRLLKPEPDDMLDDEDVWSVACFWIPRGNRRQGVGRALLDGAVEYAFAQGAAAVEGYPVDTDGEKAAAASIFTGTAAMFADAGFSEVFRRSDRRPVMRRAASER
jgi:ribosomal protein S18 acetylase RimI-like enzyme